MVKSFEVPVNPAVLEWARVTSGLTVEVAAVAVHRDPQAIAAWESGKSRPTFFALEDLANAYRRTVATLLLPGPPPSPPQPADFRAATGAAPELSFDSRVALRRAQWLQESAAEISAFKQSDSWFGSLALPSDPVAVAREARDRLKIPVGVQMGWPNDYVAFRAWRQAVEGQGVLVFQFSLPLDELRGLSLTAGRPPVIVLASGDYIRARSFSLFHEYAHLLLGAGGLCIPERGLLYGATVEVERFCNAFAGAVLVPAYDLEHDLEAREITSGGQINDRVLEGLASRFHVSRPVMLYRLFDVGHVDRDAFYEKWREWEALNRGKQKATSSGGPRMARAERRILQYGERFVGRVLDAHDKGEVTTGQALEILSLHVGDLPDAASLIGTA